MTNKTEQELRIVKKVSLEFQDGTGLETVFPSLIVILNSETGMLEVHGSEEMNVQTMGNIAEALLEFVFEMENEENFSDSSDELEEGV